MKRVMKRAEERNPQGQIATQRDVAGRDALQCRCDKRIAFFARSCQQPGIMAKRGKLRQYLCCTHGGLLPCWQSRGAGVRFIRGRPGGASSAHPRRLLAAFTLPMGEASS